MVALRPQFGTLRGSAERIVQLAEFLQPRDRDLLRAIYSRGVAMSELARAAQRPARAVQRRARALVAHITRPEFAFIAAHHETWPAVRRHVAAMVFLQRRRMTDAARVLRVSMYTIRRERVAISILVEQARALGRLGEAQKELRDEGTEKE
jgi:hypothetical protein